MTKWFFLFALLMASCKSEYHQTAFYKVNATNQQNGVDNINTKAKLVEVFSDSLQVGRKKLNKFELRRYASGDSNYVVIRFSSKITDKWVVRNEFHFSKDPVADCDPNVSDFNNDGLNDITYVSAVAARGANEVRTLFIYNRKKDNLIYVKNSDQFPNMLYNEELNCIDAFLVSGCKTTVFLKLEADSLRQVASVDQCDSITVKTYDKRGLEKTILKKEANQGDGIRYKNYNPLKEN